MIRCRTVVPRNSFRQSILFIALAAAGCGSSSVTSQEAAFRERDRDLLHRFQEARADYDEGRISRTAYLVMLGELETEEKRLTEDVRRHTFMDITEHNYWYRGRLKFPSPIAQARKAMESQPSPWNPGTTQRP